MSERGGVECPPTQLEGWGWRAASPRYCVLPFHSFPPTTILLTPWQKLILTMIIPSFSRRLRPCSLLRWHWQLCRIPWSRTEEFFIGPCFTFRFPPSAFLSMLSLTHLLDHLVFSDSILTQATGAQAIAVTSKLNRSSPHACTRHLTSSPLHIRRMRVEGQCLPGLLFPKAMGPCQANQPPSLVYSLATHILASGRVTSEFHLETPSQRGG